MDIKLLHNGSRSSLEFTIKPNYVFKYNSVSNLHPQECWNVIDVQLGSLFQILILETTPAQRNITKHTYFVKRTILTLTN